MPAPAPSTSSQERGSGRRALWVLAVITLIIAVPVVITRGISWLDWAGTWSGAGRPQPKWVTSGEVRATTSDGTLVKLRVSFDVGSSDTKAAAERHLRELGLLLEVSIGAQSTPELAGEQGIQRLSRDMLERVNAYLATEGVEPIRRVAIQDLWYTRP
jgi:flagellar basal body-associated protein FliL